MPRAGLSTARVVEAGADLADEIGFAEVSVSALARRLGVRTPSLYAHVEGSDDLRTRIALAGLAGSAEVVVAAVAGRAGRDALGALAGAYRAYARAHPGRYAASRLRLDPATGAASAGPRHSETIRAVLRGYAVPEDEHVHAVRLVGSTVHGFIELTAAGGFDHSEPDADASWSRIVDALDAALTHWPG